MITIKIEPPHQCCGTCRYLETLNGGIVGQCMLRKRSKRDLFQRGTGVWLRSGWCLKLEKRAKEQGR